MAWLGGTEKTLAAIQELVARQDAMAEELRQLSSSVQALAGRGKPLGETLSQLNTYLDGINPSVPDLRENLRELVGVARTYEQAAPDVIEALREAGGEEIPVVVGGIIPEADVEPLKTAGVAAVYTPKDFDLNRIMVDIAELVAAGATEPQPA